jgi:hypothetical protein
LNCFMNIHEPKSVSFISYSAKKLFGIIAMR